MKISSERKIYILLFIIIVLTAAIYLISFRPGHNWGGDFSEYIAQARSISEGHDFPGEFTGTYVASSVGPDAYPWGFPLLLSPIYSLFGLNIFAMKVYVSLFFLFSLPVIFLLFKEKLTSVQALLLVTIFALNPEFFYFKDKVLSDIPFFFFSLLSILLIQEIVINKKIWINRFVSYSLIGFFIFCSYFIRTQGILLIPTLLVCQFINNRIFFQQDLISCIRSNKSEFIPYIVFITFVVVINNVFPKGGNGYYELLLQNLTIQSVIRNIYYYTVLMSDFFGSRSIAKVLFGITVPFATLGIIKNAKEDYLYLIYVFFTLLLLIFWPHQQGLRFIFSMLPFYVYFLFMGLSKIPTSLFISDKFNPLNWNLVNIASVMLILYSCLYTGAIYDRYHSSVIEGPYTAESVEMFDYISTNTSKRDIIAFRKPRVMTLYTDRTSLLSNKFNKFDQIISSKVNYLVCWEHLPKPLLITIIKDNEESFELVFQNNKFKIYKIIRPFSET
ncbi:MAG: hypothetical protein JRC93_00585 [Deltaproteobacteria bacterium]|nr:hypothetical protein [Deltaproteobacteria bacterium]